MNTKLMFSQKSDEWATPKEFYKILNKEFSFDYDPCPINHKKDAMRTSWGKRCFVNPPYSNIRGFIERALHEISCGHTKIAVFLVPARTDTKWFHEYVYKKSEIRFIKGRLKFGDGKNSAPFPSMVFILK